MIKCDCGEKGCTTEIVISLPGGEAIDLEIWHKKKNGDPEKQTIMLRPDSIIQLIRRLKDALIQLA